MHKKADHLIDIVFMIWNIYPDSNLDCLADAVGLSKTHVSKAFSRCGYHLRGGIYRNFHLEILDTTDR